MVVTACVYTLRMLQGSIPMVFVQELSLLAEFEVMSHCSLVVKVRLG